MKSIHTYIVLKNKENGCFFASEYIGDEYRDLYRFVWKENIEAAEHFKSIDEIKKCIGSHMYSQCEIIKVTETIVTTRRYKKLASVVER